MRALGVGHPVFGGLEHLRQSRATEIGHAEQSEPRGGIVVHRINRDDVGVLELREDLRFLSLGAGDLERDEPVSQIDLLGEIDRREGSLAEDRDE